MRQYVDLKTSCMTPYTLPELNSVDFFFAGFVGAVEDDVDEVDLR